ncbi:MAG: hypothetical protein ACI8WT_003895 [Clostridium sp.]|jgi:hypothetical protein
MIKHKISIKFETTNKVLEIAHEVFDEDVVRKELRVVHTITNANNNIVKNYNER